MKACLISYEPKQEPDKCELWLLSSVVDPNCGTLTNPQNRKEAVRILMELTGSNAESVARADRRGSKIIPYGGTKHTGIDQITWR